MLILSCILRIYKMSNHNNQIQPYIFDPEAEIEDEHQQQRLGRLYVVFTGTVNPISREFIRILWGG